MPLILSNRAQRPGPAAGGPLGGPGGGWQRLRPRPGAVLKAGRGEIEGEIAALAAALEPALRAAVEAYLLAQRDAVTLKALAAALRSGDPAAVAALVAGADTGPHKAQLREALGEAVAGAGAAAALAVPRINRVTFAFDRYAQPLNDWLNRYAFDLIREVDAATLQGVRQAVRTGMAAGQHPIAQARQVKAGIGLTDRQAQAVANYRKQLEEWHGRGGAKGFNLGAPISRRNGRQVYAITAEGEPKDGITERRLRDFRFDGQLKRAMGGGKPLDPAVIDKMVEAYGRRYLRYRSETIATTEAARANNAGIQEAWRQAIAAGHVAENRLRRVWKVAPDERLCLVCAPVPKLNPKEGVLFGQPFRTPAAPVMLPPLHPRCRCSVWITISLAAERDALAATAAASP